MQPDEISGGRGTTMRSSLLLLTALCLLQATPAACQKAGILLRGPVAHGQATPQQADSIAAELQQCLASTGVLELLPATTPGLEGSAQTSGHQPLADEVIEGKLTRTGGSFALTLTSSLTATRAVETFHGEAATLAELCTRLVPTFAQQVAERHKKGRLVIRIERGFDIYPMDKYFGVSDPFVEVYVDTLLVGVTQVRQDEKDPVWDEEFLLPAVEAKTITLFVFDKDALEHRELIGRVTVPWGRDGVYSIRRPRYVRDFGKVQVSFGR
ncbi:MAG: C2 domain-containing protein [bacterium]|jgi:hypothetical protein|nr:C2 domain-containing protein [candidate division KSB1 bacterium]MDH7559079.1 C2 domain-containing protein [bacterium]